jgi:hypothetical protein
MTMRSSRADSSTEDRPSIIDLHGGFHAADERHKERRVSSRTRNKAELLRDTIFVLARVDRHNRGLESEVPSEPSDAIFLVNSSIFLVNSYSQNLLGHFFSARAVICAHFLAP